MREGEGIQGNPAGGLIFPPTLAAVLAELLPGHPILESLGSTALSDILTRVFFASLQREEREHYPVRVALTGGHTRAGDIEALEPGWKYLRFRNPCACTTRNLLRLARAARSERLFITIAGTLHGDLAVTGLAREGPDEGSIVQVRALEPGSLEIWTAGRRVLEYVQGNLQSPPEDLLLSSGLVRGKLLLFAAEAHAPAGYIESIASIVRRLADHAHGGILVLSAADPPELPAESTFALQADTHLWDVLHELGSLQRNIQGAESAATALLRGVLRTEIERTIGELGSMTALDGATILDRRLGLHGFGVVLPVRSDVAVHEVLDAAGRHRRPFALDQYGARHRAAASYAASHPGSLVFIASASGEMGCMLREEHGAPVMLWRFKSGDLASPAP